ncbi:MAG: hypothetical protein ABFS12_06410 [Bacteroidota bacterium]
MDEEFNEFKKTVEQILWDRQKEWSKRIEKDFQSNIDSTLPEYFDFDNINDVVDIPFVYIILN